MSVLIIVDNGCETAMLTFEDRRRRAHLVQFGHCSAESTQLVNILR